MKVKQVSLNGFSINVTIEDDHQSLSFEIIPIMIKFFQSNWAELISDCVKTETNRLKDVAEAREDGE